MQCSHDSERSKSLLIIERMKSHQKEYLISESSEHFASVQDYQMPHTKYTEASYLVNESAMNADSPSASLFNVRIFNFDQQDL